VYINNQLDLAYLSIPVMAKYRFTGGFYLETGPEVNVNVSDSSWVIRARSAWGSARCTMLG
jgi:hypothetical protein